MPQVRKFKPTWPDRRAFALDFVRTAIAIGIPQQAAEILCAHAAHSTGWGRAAWNYRLAGIKATKEEQDYTLETTGWEIVDGKRVVRPMKFRSYPSLAQGIGAMWQLLHARRYARSLALITAGDIQYARQLGKDGWYTDGIDGVYASIRAAWAQIRKWCAEGIPSGVG